MKTSHKELRTKTYSPISCLRTTNPGFPRWNAKLMIGADDSAISIDAITPRQIPSVSPGG